MWLFLDGDTRETLEVIISVDICARKFTKVKFDDAIPDVDEALNNVNYAKVNSERLSFASTGESDKVRMARKKS